MTCGRAWPTARPAPAPESSSTSGSTLRSPRRRTASTSSRIRSRRRWSAVTFQRPSSSAVPCIRWTKRAAAEAEGADYLIFGTVFPSGSKLRGHRTAGLDALAGRHAGRSGARPGHWRHLVEHRCSGRRGRRRRGRGHRTVFRRRRADGLICGGGSPRRWPGSALPSFVPSGRQRLFRQWISGAAPGWPGARSAQIGDL